MKKTFTILAISGVIIFGITSIISAQEDSEIQETVLEDTDEITDDETEPSFVSQFLEQTENSDDEEEEKVGVHQILKIKFIEGGAGFMGCIALCLIFGLSLCIERIIYLSLASINTKKLLAEIENALDKNDVERAKEVCRNTRGPVASIIYQGLSRLGEGVDVVEKSVISYGSVQMGLLEKNITWISLFIAIAPMLGFLGTVIGMVIAFDNIQQAGDISPTIVAGGIKVALLTTVFGLIVAMILQLFFNFILTKIETLTSEMEDSSISLLDIVVKYQYRNK